MSSKMSFPGFSSPAAGPEAPLDMLAACHARVEKQCQTLLRLQAHLGEHGADASAQEAANAVMRYFDTAARHHHEDEEQDLFPALLASMAGSDAVCIHELTGALIADHRRLETRWASMRLKLQAIAQGEHMPLPAGEVADFVSDYRRHIVREDTELLPMAARLLDEAALAPIGRTIRTRRGL